MPLPRLPRALRPRRLSIAGYLSLGIGGLMAVAIGGVLIGLLHANWRNTTELLQDKSRMLLGSLVTQTERETAAFLNRHFGLLTACSGPRAARGTRTWATG